MIILKKGEKMMISKEIHTETEFSEDLAEALKNVPPEAKWKLEGIITGLKMATQAKNNPRPNQDRGNGEEG